MGTICKKLPQLSKKERNGNKNSILSWFLESAYAQMGVVIADSFFFFDNYH